MSSRPAAVRLEEAVLLSDPVAELTVSVLVYRPNADQHERTALSQNGPTLANCATRQTLEGNCLD